MIPSTQRRIQDFIRAGGGEEGEQGLEYPLQGLEQGAGAREGIEPSSSLRLYPPLILP